MDIVFDGYNYEEIRKIATAKRRFSRSYSRLLFLKFSDFNFGRVSFLTLTISNEYIDNKKEIDNARNRIQRYLRRRGVKYYVIAKEKGLRSGRLHYHLILFNSPYLPQEEIKKIWRVSELIPIIKEVSSEYAFENALFYLVYYATKGINLQFSRGFFKEGLIRNDVYYTLKRDKETGVISSSNIFGTPFITKRDYQILRGRLPLPKLQLYREAFKWQYFDYNGYKKYIYDTKNYDYYLSEEVYTAWYNWAVDFLRENYIFL